VRDASAGHAPAARLWPPRLVVLRAAGCATMNPDHDARKAHHRPEGFQNIDRAAWMPRPFGEFFRWQREHRQLVIPPPQVDLSAVAPDVAYIRANRSEFAVTWIGHATALVQVGGLNILTDPHFSDRASPVQWMGPKRWQPPALRARDLPHVDLVLISHNHYDHLDADSVAALNAQAGGPPRFVVPLGLDRWLEGAGVAQVRALDWWDRIDVQGFAVHLVPAQHWSRRTLADTNTTLWGGFVVEAPAARGEAARRVYWAGDSGWSERHFSDIGARFAPIDLALLPIGAYEPRWFMRQQHVNPEEAVRIHRSIGARRSLGIHWGTFQLTDEALDAPLRELEVALRAAGLSADDFRTLRPGQTWKLH
jgi:N-acyl-phosphatidylethanolamine-hydrolysing phospholipase D